MAREYKEISFKLADVTDAGTFRGYASTWDGKPDGYNDVISRGAFKKSLSEHKHFPMLWSHDPRDPIGVISGREDNTGLVVHGQMALDVQRGREIHALMKMGAVTGLSIGFEAIKADAEAGGVRRLREIKLYEISPVVFPACDTARIADVKAAENEKAEILRALDSIRL